MVIPLPPQARAILYWTITGLALILGAIAVWFAVTPAARPQWLDLANEILLILAAFFGITAATNTHTVRVDPTAFPPEVRKIVYWAYTILSTIVAVVSIVLRGVEGVEPWVLDAANQILIFLGAAFGFTAASHVVPNPPPTDEAQPES